MHKYLTPVIAATAVFVAGISTANAGPVSVGISIGIPAPIIVAPAPVYYPAPVVYAPAPVYYAQPRVVYAPPPVYYAPRVVYARPHHHRHYHHWR